MDSFKQALKYFLWFIVFGIVLQLLGLLFNVITPPGAF